MQGGDRIAEWEGRRAGAVSPWLAKNIESQLGVLPEGWLLGCQDTSSITWGWEGSHIGLQRQLSECTQPRLQRGGSYSPWSNGEGRAVLQPSLGTG